MAGAHKDAASFYVPARYVLAFWSFLGLVNMFALRMDINMAILDMVKNGSTSGMIPVMNRTVVAKPASNSRQPNTFQWTEYQQYLVLSAFYYGYFSTQILGGYASGRFGSKIILGLGLLVASLLTLATPFAAWQSYSLLLACRVGQGLAQGLAQPCVHTLWSNWAPESEKSILLTITYSGCQLGTILAILVSCYICELQVQGGWQTVFYIFGCAGVVWSLFWFILIHDTPSQHPRISQAEREYIQSNIKHSLNQKNIQINWAKVVTSPALYAIVAAHFANDWGNFALMTCFPSYLKNILNYDLTQNGFLSSTPFFVLLVTNPLSGWMADRLRGRQLMTTKNTRKLVNSIGLFVPSCLVLAVCFIDGSRTAVVALLVVAVGISGFTMAGYSVSHLDIAPAFAGTLFGITNTIGTTTGFVGPVILGALTKSQNTLQHWNTFFYITSGIFFTGGLLFLLFAQGEPQPWISTPSECSLQESAGTQNNSDTDKNVADTTDFAESSTAE
ncbi:hypothetical protein BsWGS_24367 [Bradybaena similaris]